MKRLVLLAVLAIVVAIFTLPAFAQGNAAEGAKILAREKCTMCHAVNGKGNAKYPLDDVGSKLKPDEIREWIVNPSQEMAKLTPKPAIPMKSFANLPKQDVDNLVAYLETLKKK